MPERLQSLMEEYEKRRAAEEAAQGWAPRLFYSRWAGVLGMGVSGGLMFLIYSLDDVSSELHVFLGWLLSRLDRAQAHTIFLRAAAQRWLPKDYDKDDPYLVIEPEEGLRFMTPVGLAAGFDIGAVAPDAFFDLGFGFVEVGPVGGAGAASAAERLASRDSSGQLAHLGIVGVAISGGRQELLSSVAVLGTHADYLAVDLAAVPANEQGEEALRQLVADVVAKAATLPGEPKVFLRVPASWPQAGSSASARRAAAVAAGMVAVIAGADGLILCENDVEGGNVDDEPAWVPSLDIISDVYRRTGGRLVLVSSGGVLTGRGALDRVEAGATVVQISSLLLSEGPQACRRIKNELSQLLTNEGYVNLHDAVGVAHRKNRRGRRRNLWRAKDAS